MEVAQTFPLLPGDPSLIDHIVRELKSQGIFDQFRKECISDVDTRPAYQNLRQRVEGAVAGFLHQQAFSPALNKNQLREKLRKHILDSNFLDQGVERIVDQVVNPKIATVFLPQVEEVMYKALGIEKPKRPESMANGNHDSSSGLQVNTEDLLPNDLESLSPDSVKSQEEKKDVPMESYSPKPPADAPETKEDIEMKDEAVKDQAMNSNMDSDSSKDEDFESPAFEPLEGSFKAEDSPDNSHLSGMSDFESNEYKKKKSENVNNDSQMSSDSNASPNFANKGKLKRFNADDDQRAIPYKADTSDASNTPRYKFTNDDNSSDARQCFETVPESTKVIKDRTAESDNALDNESSVDNITKLNIKSGTSSETAGQTPHIRSSVDSKTSSEGNKNQVNMDASMDSNESKTSNLSANIAAVTKITYEVKETFTFENRINALEERSMDTEDSSGDGLKIDLKESPTNNDMHVDTPTVDEVFTEMKSPSDVKESRKSRERNDSHKSRSKDDERRSSTSHRDKKDDSKHHSRSSHRHSSSGRHESDHRHKSSHDRSKNSSKDSKSDRHSSSHKSSRHSTHHSSDDKARRSSDKPSEKHHESKDSKSDSKRDSKTNGRKESSSSHRDSKSSSSKLGEKSSDHRSGSSKDKSSSRHSHSDRSRRPSSHSDKKPDDKKGKEKSNSDHCSSSKTGRTRRSTDRDSNDGNSHGNKANTSQTQNTSVVTPHKDAKTSNSSTENTSNGNYSSGQSDTLNISAGGYIKSEFNMFQPIVKKPLIPEPPPAIKSPDISSKKPVNIDSQLAPVKVEEKPAEVETSPAVSTIKKPRFASNMSEAKRLMKVRRNMDIEEQKRQQEAAKLAEKESNLSRNESQVYSGVSGPELEFACVKSPKRKLSRDLSPPLYYFDEESKKKSVLAFDRMRRNLKVYLSNLNGTNDKTHPSISVVKCDRNLEEAFKRMGPRNLVIRSVRLQPKKEAAMKRVQFKRDDSDSDDDYKNYSYENLNSSGEHNLKESYCRVTDIMKNPSKQDIMEIILGSEISYQSGIVDLKHLHGNQDQKFESPQSPDCDEEFQNSSSDAKSSGSSRKRKVSFVSSTEDEGDKSVPINHNNNLKGRRQAKKRKAAQNKGIMRHKPPTKPPPPHSPESDKSVENYHSAGTRSRRGAPRSKLETSPEQAGLNHSNHQDRRSTRVADGNGMQRFSVQLIRSDAL